MDKAYTCAVFTASILNIGTTTKNKSFFTFDVPDELVSRLSNMSLSDLRAIAKHSSRFITVRIDPPELDAAMHLVANDSENAELQDQLILHKATATMMRKFFGMHTTEFCARRKRLGLTHEGQHRPLIFDEDTEALVWKEFQQLHHLEIRHRYLKVAENTGLPLNAIWSVIQKYQG